MNKQDELFASVIVPVFNEEDKIQVTTEKIMDYFRKNDLRYEIILVDDGSKDKTLEKMQEIKRKHDEVKVFTHVKNRGKGFTVKKGVLQAKGRFIIVLDADYSTSIEEFGKFKIWLMSGYPVVIGSRKMKGAKVEVRQSYLRENLGKVFTICSNLLITSNLSDITCGFKCFHNHAAKDIFIRQRLNRWSYDSETLFIAQKIGYEIKELPVVWNNDSNTKVNLLKDSLVSFWELLKIRFYCFRGDYAKQYD